MDIRKQAEKAEQFRKLHHGPRLLLLPNAWDVVSARILEECGHPAIATRDRKSTRLNSSHVAISYAVFCLKKKKKIIKICNIIMVSLHTQIKIHLDSVHI